MSEEKEYFYMFSEGSYSDYCVGGLYKSKQELSSDFFIQHLRSMILDQIKNWPEAVEYFNNLPQSLSYGNLQYQLFELEAGKCPRDDYRNGSPWFKAFSEWKESVGELDVDFIADLERKGILERIEYEEIWHD